MMKIFKEPLVQFLLIGACIYGAYALFGKPEENTGDWEIHVDATRIDGYIGEWQSRWNRPPTRAEMDGVIEQFITEEVLYRQAVAMGLGKGDPITRRRMAQKLEFLTTDLAQAQKPAEGELEEYLAKHEAVFRDEDQITFSQVFFDPDKRGDATLDQAKEALATLKAAGKPDPKTMKEGDRFMLQNDFKSSMESEVRRQLGSGFTVELMKLKSGEWHGPILSGYGVHLVYVFEHGQAASPAFEEVEDLVLEAWHQQQSIEFNEALIENLRQRYDIVIDELPTERLLNESSSSVSEEQSEAKEQPTS